MKSNNSTSKNFIERAKAVHGDKYDYTLVRYRGASKQVVIGCQIHGIFKQTASLHLSGRGCPYCTNNRLTRNQFLEQANKVHFGKYDYSKCTYTHETGKSDYFTITCKTHGDFHQRVDTHLMGQGCDKCAKEAKQNRIIFIKPKPAPEPQIVTEEVGIITYPVAIRFKTAISQINTCVWSDPFESKSEAEKFVESFKLYIEMTDSELIDSTILEKKQPFLKFEHAAKLIKWLNLESYEKYKSWWDESQPDYIPRNLVEYYPKIDKMFFSDDIGIVISIINRIKLSDYDGKQIA